MMFLYFATIIFDFLTNLSHRLFVCRILPVIPAAGKLLPAADLMDTDKTGCPLCCLLGRIILACLYTDHRFGMAVRLHKGPVPRPGQIFFHLPADFLSPFRMLCIDTLLDYALPAGQFRILTRRPAAEEHLPRKFGSCQSSFEISLSLTLMVGSFS